MQENPLGAMLIAVGIGFALALLMTRLPPRSRHFGWDSRIETIEALIESRALQGWIVSDDGPLGSFTYEGRIPFRNPPSRKSRKPSKGQSIQGARDRGRWKAWDAVEHLERYAREAPLGSPLAAFLMGVAVARRRQWFWSAGANSRSFVSGHQVAGTFGHAASFVPAGS